ncbi:hypothetical protein [Nannocystis pusilla]|uniref:hypothetical protein n=1 Tax=Nannocystis pusilla TaxID=889268 RepID=UPI003DA35DB2
MQKDEFRFGGQYDSLKYEIKLEDPSAENSGVALMHLIRLLISEARLSNMEKDGELVPEEFCAEVITGLVEAWDEVRGDGGEGAVPLLQTLDDMLEVLKVRRVLPTHVARSGCEGEEFETKLDDIPSGN